MHHRDRGTVKATGFALALILVAPIGAQQPAPVASPTQENALKNNVRTFEMALKDAVVRAGAKVAQWAGQVAPNVTMAFAQEPTVRSVPLLDNSLVFHVEVAEIMPTSLDLWAEFAALKRGAPVAPLASKPGPARVGAAGLPVADPMGPGAPGLAPGNMTPDQYYTALVYEALIDTVLDSSGVLLLKEGQTLTVACDPVDVAIRDPLYKNLSRKLVLTIKGEDLLSYRKGALTREEAKQRIIERRF